MHVEHDRTEPANLVLDRHRALLPWRRGTRTAVIDQHQTLAFAVLERQRQPAIDFGDFAGMAARLTQAIAPKAKAAFARDAQ